MFSQWFQLADERKQCPWTALPNEHLDCLTVVFCGSVGLGGGIYTQAFKCQQRSKVAVCLLCFWLYKTQKDLQITLKKFGCLKNFLLCERRHAEQMKCKPFSMVMGREVSKYRGRTHVFPRRHGQNPEKINNIPGIMPVFSHVAMSQLVCHPSLSFFLQVDNPPNPGKFVKSST